jgi:hypothetical protein
MLPLTLQYDIQEDIEVHAQKKKKPLEAVSYWTLSIVHCLQSTKQYRNKAWGQALLPSSCKRNWESTYTVRPVRWGQSQRCVAVFQYF